MWHSKLDIRFGLENGRNKQLKKAKPYCVSKNLASLSFLKLISGISFGGQDERISDWM